MKCQHLKGCFFVIFLIKYIYEYEVIFLKKILLSADGPVYLCLVPDIVEKNLQSYIKDYDEYVFKYKTIRIDEYHYRSLVEEVIGFIEWLNENFEEKSSVVKVLDEKELEQYDCLEWWNW